MKKVGFVLASFVLLLTLYTISLAQFEASNARRLGRITSALEEGGL
jgi:hypothetical protein